jgi:hypothetical protein
MENSSLVPFGGRSLGIWPKKREKLVILSQAINYKDFMAVDAVQCELLSAANSR